MSYFQWVEYFENLKTAPMDDELLKKIESKTLDGGEYVVSRFTHHIIDTVNTRINNSYNACVDRMYISNIDVNTLSMDLINLKKEKRFAKKIVNLPVFVDSLRQTFLNTIDNTFNDISLALRKNIEYIDVDGEYINTFEKIMLSSMEE